MILVGNRKVVWEDKGSADAKSQASISDHGDQLKNHIDEPAAESPGGFMYKIDLFMRSHILPRFDAGKIRWWLSLQRFRKG